MSHAGSSLSRVFLPGAEKDTRSFLMGLSTLRAKYSFLCRVCSLMRMKSSEVFREKRNFEGLVAQTFFSDDGPSFWIVDAPGSMSPDRQTLPDGQPHSSKDAQFTYCHDHQRQLQLQKQFKSVVWLIP